MNLESIPFFYNYDTTEVQYNEKSIKTDGYVKTPFSSQPNNPAIHFQDTNYRTETMYIFKNIHKEYPECEGELVIEHVPITNGFKKIYLCFPLRRDTTSFSSIMDNGIDEIIESTDRPIKINIMNFMIPNTEFTAYETKGLIYADLVVLSNRPILIKADMTNLQIPPRMFKDHTDDFAIIQPQKKMHIEEDVKEGFETDVPVYCTPVDTLGDGVELEASLTIPILGEYSNSIQSTQIMFQIMNFVYVIFAFGIIAILTPLIYSFGIVTLIDDKDLSAKSKKFISVMMVFTWLIFCGFVGLTSGNSGFIYIVLGMTFKIIGLCFLVNVFTFHNNDMDYSISSMIPAVFVMFSIFSNTDFLQYFVIIVITIFSIILLLGLVFGVSSAASTMLFIILVPIAIWTLLLTKYKVGN